MRVFLREFWPSLALGSILICSTPLTAAQTSQFWNVDAVAMRLPDGQAFVETQTSWTSDLNLDSMVCTILAVQDDEVVSFTKQVLQSVSSEDGSPLLNVFVNRLVVDPGPVTLEWSIEHNDKVLFETSLAKRIGLDGMPECSEPIVVSSYGQANETSNPAFVHSGMELIPLVGRVLPQDVSSALMYMELYNLDDVVDPGTSVELTYGWSDATGSLLPGTAMKNVATAAAVVPVLVNLSCTPTQPDRRNPSFTMKVSTAEGHEVMSSTFSLGKQPVQAAMEAALAEAPLPSLVDLSLDVEAMKRHVEDHLAMATATEQFTMEQVLIPQGDLAQMTQYLTAFWLGRAASFQEADGLHVNYVDRIRHVDEAYGNCKSGQGSLTEMGNIYLRFGKPTTVVKRHHETDYYPYEIWHYYRAGRFTNKRFLFYAPHVVGECFELLHSDMLGERQNDDWLSQLRSRENRLRVTESMENRLNPRDAFSREEPEDLFYNPR